ncbi:uncharacterized protein LOC130649309 [Hydractinia symbiolongicarpus]|uniref:uncharacterized protein LOC130649309 n=1 Tax=Hydractinia symbiolongicarpus TaxID=13093 RepID=UPI002551ACEE|nr:uncharacterized protein LOC130649309 [Hydractinia symbiolongicarpus]
MTVHRLVARRFTYDIHENQHNFWQLVKHNSEPLRYGNYQLKILSNPKHILEAEKMVSMMFDECHWTWEPSNPSDFERHVDSDGKTYITDSMEENSIWGGAFKDDDLVSCIRLVYRTKNAGLDVEKYPLNKELRTLLSKNNVVEIERGLTLPQHRGKALNKLLCGVFGMYSKIIGSDMVSTSPAPHYVRDNIGTVVDDQFDYGDGNKILFLYYSQKDLEKIIDHVKYMTDNKKSS